MYLKEKNQSNTFATAIQQICIVTKDFDNAVRFMTSSLGIGPFKIWNFENPTLFNQTFLGKSAEWTMRLGVALIGGIQWEIIEPIKGPNLYSEFLQQCGDGPHHILLETKGTSFKNATKYFEDIGFTKKQSAMINMPIKIGTIAFPTMPNFLRELSSVEFCYLESEKLSGTVLELAHLPLGLSMSTALRIGKADVVIPSENDDVLHRLPNAFIDKITKISFVTHNISTSIETWTTVFGKKSWQMEENTTTYQANIATTSIEGILLELIEPVAKGSPHEQLLNKRGPGISTIGVCTHSLSVDQIITLMQSLDTPILMQGTDDKGHGFVTVDTAKNAHVWLEITSMKNS